MNSYCLVDQCVAPDTIARDLSVVVTPSDPALAPQQFLPDQYQTVNGFSTILLTAPQILSGPVTLPANCGDAGIGYPVHFEFTGPTLIPGVPNDFQFDTDENGNLSAVLPIGSYSESVSTSVACAAPLFATDVVISANQFDKQPFYAPILPGENDDAGPSLDISGEVTMPDSGAGLPATVRILALDEDAGVPSGVRLSGDQPLQPPQFIDGIRTLRFGSTFVPGGPAALPVLPYGSTPPSVPGIIQHKLSSACYPKGTTDPTPTTCDQFVVEIGPSSTWPCTIDYTPPNGAPELDGGENPVIALPPIPQLPLTPTLTLDLPIVAIVGPDAGPVPSAAVTIASVDGGIPCGPASLGFVCRLTATGVTDPASGTFTFQVVPGRYALTLDPPAPLGSSVTVIDVLADGGAPSVVSGPGMLDGGQLQLPAVPAVEVLGTVREPGPTPDVDGPLLPSGEVEFLTVSGLAPVALTHLSSGTFNLRVAPGQYVLLIEPDSSTRFPVRYVPITVQESLPPQSYTLDKPALLTGIVEVEVDAGFPVPTQAYLEFYFVTSDSDGGVVAYPVATAVTDAQGRWSAPGPPPEQ